MFDFDGFFTFHGMFRSESFKIYLMRMSDETMSGGPQFLQLHGSAKFKEDGMGLSHGMGSSEEYVEGEGR